MNTQPTKTLLEIDLTAGLAVFLYALVYIFLFRKSLNDYDQDKPPEQSIHLVPAVFSIFLFDLSGKTKQYQRHVLIALSLFFISLILGFVITNYGYRLPMQFG